MSCCASIANFTCGCCTSQLPKSAELNKIHRNRSCTDKLILLLYLISWAGSVYILQYCTANGGNIQRITYGTDMQGQICGQGVNAGLSYNVMPNPLLYNYTVCASDCAVTNQDTSSTPMAILYPSTAIGQYCIPDVNTTYVNQMIQASLSYNGGSSNGTSTSVALDMYNSLDSAVSRSIADLYTAWPVFPASIGITLVIALVFTVLCRYVTGLFIWGIISLVAAAGVASAYFFWSNQDEQLSETRYKAYRYTGIGIGAADIVFVLIVFAMRKRIQIAIEVIKESAVALTDILSLLLFPIIPLALAAAYTVYFICLALMLYSTGVPVSTSRPPPALITTKIYGFDSSELGHSNSNSNIQSTSTFEWNNTFRILGAYHVFHLLWTFQTIYYFSFLSISMTISDWYFTPRDAQGNKLKSGPDGLSTLILTKNTLRVIRYHLGTVMFAALLVAIIQFIRLVVYYVEKHTRGKDGNGPNKLQKAIFCCVQCLLSCLQSIMERVNANALIYTGITSDSFCSAGMESFALCWRNLFRVAAINMVSSIIVFVGKVAVTAVTVAICTIGLLRLPQYNDNLTSTFVPLFVVLVLAYTVASLYFSLFSTVIDTIFLDFLIDSEQNVADGRAMVAPLSLQHLVGKYAEESQKEADAQVKHLNTANGGHVHPSQQQRSSSLPAPYKMQPQVAETNYIG